jgi:hypothetical protein
VSEASTDTICRIGHARWDIEEDAFNYLCTYYHIGHAFRHDLNAILVFVLTACIVYVLVCAFYHLNLKSPVRQSCCMATLTLHFWLTLDFSLSSILCGPIRAPT